ncbi:helix-turn-helix transcriptional regulator [Providencia huaxiensis]|uniref:helix-turn-helix transcriptional regulator n=1 Tax=Providencia huaxiensis TaxID=2027290 RepID=UPI003756A698
MSNVPMIKILRLPEVMARISVSRSTIYDWLNPISPRYDPTFPIQIRLGKQSVGWAESAINEWLKNKTNCVFEA